jgi:hypothetical protein
MLNRNIARGRPGAHLQDWFPADLRHCYQTMLDRLSHRRLPHNTQYNACLVNAALSLFVCRPAATMVTPARLFSRERSMRSVRRLFLALLIATVPQAISAQVIHRIQGRVTDAATRQAISGAWIEIGGTDLRKDVDAQGAFALELSGGSHTLLAHAFGYRTAQVRIDLRADTTLSLLLQVEPLVMQGIAVQADRLTARSRALPWPVRSVAREELARSAAPTPVEALKERRLQLVPCPWGTMECVRHRNVPTPVLVCIDERVSGLDELRTWPNHSLYKIEVHDRGRMVRAYTIRFMEQVLAGKRDFRHVLRTDDPSC